MFSTATTAPTTARESVNYDDLRGGRCFSRAFHESGLVARDDPHCSASAEDLPGNAIPALPCPRTMTRYYIVVSSVLVVSSSPAKALPSSNGPSCSPMARPPARRDASAASAAAVLRSLAIRVGVRHWAYGAGILEFSQLGGFQARLLSEYQNRYSNPQYSNHWCQ